MRQRPRGCDLGAADVAWRGTVPPTTSPPRPTPGNDRRAHRRAWRSSRRCALIAGARHHVTIQTYVWEPDSEAARQLLAGLAELAARRAADDPTAPPVEVRVMLDASTIGFGSTPLALPRLWAAVEALQLDPAHVTFELAAMYHATFGTLHVKTVVVDGRDAIVTGANPQTHHDPGTPWRDAGFHLTGEVAVSLLADFDSGWRQASLWTCGADEAAEPQACAAPTPRPTYVVRRPRLAAGTCRPMLIATREIDESAFADRIDNPQDQAFLAGWAAARRHIRVQTPNLNDDAAKAGLLAAVLRGVQVDVVLSRGFNDLTEALPGQGGTNAHNVTKLYQALADAGVTDACDRLRIRWHARDGVAVDGNGAYASHAKYASIDDEVAIVGTANMDTQSWNNSRELNVVVDDADLTAAWDEQLFLADFEGGVPVDACR
ncbi:MAG: phosphatidylserine/phosphatidylglycerophosphate/cardiolipin synthase family protein [Kofleriaceae bacterium]